MKNTGEPNPPPQTQFLFSKGLSSLGTSEQRAKLTNLLDILTFIPVYIASTPPTPPYTPK